MKSFDAQTQQRTTGSGRPHPSGFTSQQILILLLVGFLGSAALILSAVLLLSSAPQPDAPGQGLAAQGQTLTEPPAPQASPDPQSVPQASPAEALVVPAGCAQASTGVQSGTIRQVIDAATLEVVVDSGPVKVRFAGIEIDASSASAFNWLTGLLPGQAVLLVRDQAEQDANGRLVRYVFMGQRFINEELVRQGFAQASNFGPDRACAAQLQLSEKLARQDHLGIWQPTQAPTATFMPFVTLDPNQQSCDCSKRYECSDFATHIEAQACFNACNDYNSRLDDDRDGIACESLP